MRTVEIRNTVIGEGIPKICVPVMGGNKEDILESARRAAEERVDLAEWRADFFEGISETNAVEEVLRELRKILGSIPLLFTFRTKEEGGSAELETDAYIRLNLDVIRKRQADLVDIELFKGENHVDLLCKECLTHGTKLLMSNHDFEKTPEKDEIVKRLTKMQNLGADIAKIAVMPKKKEDVKKLLDATWEMQIFHDETPVVTMSMGDMGVISRVCGEFYGSSVTFGCIGQASAPGQLEVGILRQMLHRFAG